MDLQTGEYVDEIDVVTYDPIRAAKDSATSIALSLDEDIATLRRRENVSLVYLKATASGIEKVVMPVRGYGLWGTLYGYLGLDGDLNTIAGLGFYQHKETPGLGGEVDNSKRKASWQGVPFNDMGQLQVKLVKQRSASSNPAASYEVDALFGATFTTKGVENMVNYWTGDDGWCLSEASEIKRLTGVGEDHGDTERSIN